MALQAPNHHWYAISVPLPAQRFYGQENRLAIALTASLNEIVTAQMSDYAPDPPD